MQIVRTIVWVVILAALLIFTAFNWNPVEVQIWTNIVLETKIPALVIVAFLLGLVPMWLIHRGTKWRLKRRIAGLESAARANATAAAATPVVTEPVAPTRPGDGVETEATTTDTDDEPAIAVESDTAPTRPDNP
ncbi:hypothetical protein [Erythrobacter sp. A6_0]|uniref:hypothetical protein n=1 Tax=Erythrobacter sp. A6_0 TaxID=2821089 RepID=UPI001ADB39B5|nr:hypothetical protein [Erythrobacter sp. A6_0]MBO9511023.1 hypothetical protein [Erythrobacter sp. A6_0]